MDTVQTRIAGIPVLGVAGPGSLAIADLVKTAAGGVEVQTSIERIDPGPAPPGTRIAATLDTFSRRRDSLARRPVAQLKSPLTRTGSEHALGGMIAEARRNLARADLGLVREASIYADLPAGPVTLARLRAVEPAGADLVRLTLSGTQVQALLERALDAGDQPFVHLAGGVVRYDPRAPAGQRLKEVTLVGGKKVKAKRELHPGHRRRDGRGRGRAHHAGRCSGGAGGVAGLGGRRRLPSAPPPAGRGRGLVRVPIHPSLSGRMRVFVNAVPLEVDTGADVRAAVRALDAELERKLAAGSAYVTDARGIEVTPDATLAEGSILRVVVSARRTAEERDAHA